MHTRSVFWWHVFLTISKCSQVIVPLCICSVSLHPALCLLFHKIHCSLWLGISSPLATWWSHTVIRLFLFINFFPRNSLHFIQLDKCWWCRNVSAASNTCHMCLHSYWFAINLVWNSDQLLNLHGSPKVSVFVHSLFRGGTVRILCVVCSAVWGMVCARCCGISVHPGGLPFIMNDAGYCQIFFGICETSLTSFLIIFGH